MLLPELPWIKEARSLVGLREIVGPKHSPRILQWLVQLGAAWNDDETPWCGTFVAHCLSTAGRPVPKHWYRAKAYAEGYGTLLKKPAYGCVAVKSRVGGGHVFFVVGELEDGSLVGLGGNQGNQVSLARFSRDSVIAYVWPPHPNGVPSVPSVDRYVLPQFGATVKDAPSEA